MIIKNKQQRKRIREATLLSTEILRSLYEAAAPGVYPIELDALAFKLCKKYEVQPSFYGVQGATSRYQHASCIYVNDEVVHGIPSSTRPLQESDLVTIDFGLIYEGFYTDHCVTVGLEPVAERDRELLRIGRAAVLGAVEQARAGARTGDLGQVMLRTAQAAGFETVKQYVGHGIGRTLHEYPELPAFGVAGKGEPLEKGMLICVEAQVVAGDDELVNEADGWTVKTKDGQNSVMFEYMVEVRATDQRILTPTQEWPLTKG